MKKPKNKPTDLVELGIKIDEVVDILNPVEGPRIAIPVEEVKMDLPKSEYEELFIDIDGISKEFDEMEKKMAELSSLFSVKREGDDLERSYNIVFNEEKMECDDPLCSHIFQLFVDRYGLDLTNLAKRLRIARDMIEAKLLRGQPYYCEVDLLAEKIDPVKC